MWSFGGFHRPSTGEGGQFQPVATVIPLAVEPIEFYDTHAAIMLLWVKAFLNHGWTFYAAQEGAENIENGCFEDLENAM